MGTAHHAQLASIMQSLGRQAVSPAPLVLRVSLAPELATASVSIACSNPPTASASVLRSMSSWTRISLLGQTRTPLLTANLRSLISASKDRPEVKMASARRPTTLLLVPRHVLRLRAQGRTTFVQAYVTVTVCLNWQMFVILTASSRASESSYRLLAGLRSPRNLVRPAGACKLLLLAHRAMGLHAEASSHRRRPCWWQYRSLMGPRHMSGLMASSTH